MFGKNLTKTRFFANLNLRNFVYAPTLADRCKTSLVYTEYILVYMYTNTFPLLSLSLSPSPPLPHSPTLSPLPPLPLSFSTGHQVQSFTLFSGSSFIWGKDFFFLFTFFSPFPIKGTFFLFVLFPAKGKICYSFSCKRKIFFLFILLFL